MGPAEALFLLAAGLAAGTVNAVAGGGSLVTFPALLAVGLAPVPANVTNSVAVFPGYLGAVAGSRHDLAGQRRRAVRLAATAAVGSVAGAVLLLATPARLFEVVVPFLVLGATAALAFQHRLRRLVGRPRGLPPGRAGWSAQVVAGLGAVYGGYFGAALGVALVALLALVLDESLARISALKNLLSAAVGLITVLVFGLFGPVDWQAVAVLAPATVVGGYTGAALARRLPERLWRVVIVGFGTVIGVILLLRAW